MRDPLVAGLNGYGVLALAAHWCSLWLGMYLVSRRPRYAASVLAGLAFIAVSTYLFEVALYNSPTSVAGIVTRAKWLAGAVMFGPPLLLHASVRVAQSRAAWMRWLTVLAYAFAAVVFVGGFFNNVFNNYGAVQVDAHGYTRGIPPGPFYWVMAVQLLATMVAALVVLSVVRRSRPTLSGRALRELRTAILGIAMIVFGLCLLSVVDSRIGSVSEIVVVPIPAVGAALIAFSVLAYSGRLDERLLWADFRASLLGMSIAMALFVTVCLLLGASGTVLAVLGWIVLLLVVLGDRVQTLADSFYPAWVRVARLGLRTAADYAGTLGRLDVDALSPEQASELIRILGVLSRVNSTPAEIVDRTAQKLLARSEYALVRIALGLSTEWTLEDGLSLPAIRKAALVSLPQRNRRALALWHLGYSDKEIAPVMGVTPNTVRSYREEGKKKLGLDTKRSIALYVHLAGFVDSDALPLLDSPKMVGEVPVTSAAEVEATSDSSLF